MTDQWPSTVKESQARLHAEILAKVQEWPSEVRMDWAEMAAVLEYDQGNERARAEQLAFWRIKKEKRL
jgi:hypothetical protein